MVSTIVGKTYAASNTFSGSVNTENATDTVTKWSKSAGCFVWVVQIVPACVCVCVVSGKTDLM